MALDVIGAGLGRTGTLSQKSALELLLGGPCHHMVELLTRPEQLGLWDRILRGDHTDWEGVFAGYRAAVDFTSACYFLELTTAYPHALVLLSLRDTEEWWESFRRTVVETLIDEPEEGDPWERAMTPVRTLTIDLLASRFTPEWTDENACKAAYERHNAAVRKTIPADRLLEWRAGDGWDPICDALGVPIPPEPFPTATSPLTSTQGDSECSAARWPAGRRPHGRSRRYG
jgi:hypothetical protein